MRYALHSSLLGFFTLVCAGGCTPPERVFATGKDDLADGGQVTSSSSGQGGSGGDGQGGAGGIGGSGGQGGAGPALCSTDADCLKGEEWCVGGSCVPCDNSGLMCNIQCEFGWLPYTRNGCYPCACAPPNECGADTDCGDPTHQCYTGNFCWDWCPPEDPSCCYGNTCSPAGCSGPNPAGCVKTGCQPGQQCTTLNACSASTCSCSGAFWLCTKDCGGGKCIDVE